MASNHIEHSQKASALDLEHREQEPGLLQCGTGTHELVYEDPVGHWA